MQASIIIPTFQRSNFLKDALASLSAQEFPESEYEIVVVNNDPNSAGEDWKSMGEWAGTGLRVIRETKVGLHYARHAGAKAAHGEVLIYLDDDVLCPPGWLAAMLEPYRRERVGMVAGRVFLHFEAPPPPWLSQFVGILSAFDRGDVPQALPPYSSPVGCNMSVRKSILFAVGGFNPDGFADRRLLRLRGDGECGLARKVHDAGWLVWYAPAAWLEHRVPQARMTAEYIRWRSAIGGIEDAYADCRYHRRTPAKLLALCGHSAYYWLRFRLSAYRWRHDERIRMGQLAQASRLQYRTYQYLRQALFQELRLHARRVTYLT